MPAGPHDRSFRSPLKVLLVAVQALIIAACLGHATVRVWKDSHRDRWPVQPFIPSFEWIERRVRSLGAVGRIWIGPPPKANQDVEAGVQNAIVPAALYMEERDVSIVVFPREMDRDLVRSELQARGFPHVQMRPLSNIGLAGRGPLPAPLDAFPAAPAWRKLGGLLALSLASVGAALAAARRGGAHSFFAVLLAAPFTLGLASAAGDASSLPTLVTFAVWLALLAAAVPLLGRWRAEPQAPRAARPPPRAGRALLAVGVAIVAIGILEAVLCFGISPDGGVDAVRMYNLRARFILRAAGFAAPFGTDGYLLTTHADYPPLIPFAVAGAHRALGGASVLAPMWVHSCVWVAGTGLVLNWAWRAVGGLPTLTLLALLVCNTFWVRTVAEQVCDVPLALLFAAGLLALRGAMTRADHSGRAALACGVYLGFALLVKNEASLMTLAVALSVTGWSLLRWRERRALLLRIGLGFAPFAALALAFETISPVNDLVELSRGSSASWERATQIAHAFLGVITDPMLFKGAFLLALITSLAAAPVRMRDTLRGAWGARAWELCVFTTLAMMLAGIFCVYLLTPHDLSWHLATSLNRVFAQALPAAAILWASLSAGAADSRSETA